MPTNGQQRIEDEAGTIVHLRDHGYRDTPAGRRANIDCAIGWGEALALMKVYVEHGTGKDGSAPLIAIPRWRRRVEETPD